MNSGCVSADSRRTAWQRLHPVGITPGLALDATVMRHNEYRGIGDINLELEQDGLRSGHPAAGDSSHLGGEMAAKLNCEIAAAATDMTFIREDGFCCFYERAYAANIKE
jgi:hypothetical protein